MQNARLITLLKSLSPSENKKFVSYVASPFINQNDKLVKLAEFLFDISPSYKSRNLTKAYLFKLMFPGESYSEQKVHDQMSALLRLLEDYLAMIEWEKDVSIRSIYLLDSLHNRGLGEHSYRHYQKASKQLSRSIYRNSSYYYQQYKLSHVSDPILSKKQPREVAENLVNISYNLETFYLAEKLRISCEMLNRQRILNMSVDTSTADELCNYLSGEGEEFLKEPVVAIYYQIYLSLKGAEGEEHYEALVDLLDRHSGQFPPWQAYSMYVYALNYCVRNINHGKAGYREEMFQLFQTLLEKDLLLEQGVLSHAHYKNITNVGLSLKKYDWVKDFLEGYKTKLAPEMQDNAYNYNLSVFYYNQKKYKEAMVLLQQIEFSDVFYHLSAKSLLMRIYYELCDDDGFKYLVHAFQAFIKRNQKIPKYQIQAHTNFIRILKKMVNLRARKPYLDEDVYQERWQKIRASADEATPMTHARWLLDQLEELQEEPIRQEGK